MSRRVRGKPPQTVDGENCEDNGEETPGKPGQNEAARHESTRKTRRQKRISTTTQEEKGAAIS